MEILEENFDECIPQVFEEMKTPKQNEEYKLEKKPSLIKG